MARYHHYQKRYKGYDDLRDFLEDKHQRGDEYNSAPSDPPSLLRDPLRGDVTHNNRLPRNEFYRGRGRFQRRPNYTRPRGYNTPRGGHPSRMPPNPANIKIELSTESGERKCEFETGSDISDRFKSTDRGGRSNFRGRFRGYRRGRGNRGFYYSRGSRGGGKVESSSPQIVAQEEEENWNLPSEEQGCSQEKSLDSSSEVKENEEGYELEGEALEGHEEHEGEYHEGDDVYVEGEYLEEEEYGEQDVPQEGIEITSKSYGDGNCPEKELKEKVEVKEEIKKNPENLIEKTKEKNEKKETKVQETENKEKSFEVKKDKKEIETKKEENIENNKK